MKKLVVGMVAALAAVQVFAGECQCIAECGETSTSNTPYIAKKVRSPLGKEIDSLRLRCKSIENVTAEVFGDMYTRLTNITARVAALETAEAARVAEQAKRKAKAAERKEAREKREEQRKALEAAKARAKGLKQNAAAKAAREGK